MRERDHFDKNNLGQFRRAFPNPDSVSKTQISHLIPFQHLLTHSQIISFCSLAVWVAKSEIVVRHGCIIDRWSTLLIVCVCECVSRTCKPSTTTCSRSPKHFGMNLLMAPNQLTSSLPTTISQPPVHLPRTLKPILLATIKPKHLTWIALTRNSQPS